MGEGAPQGGAASGPPGVSTSLGLHLGLQPFVRACVCELGGLVVCVCVLQRSVLSSRCIS